MLTGAVDVPREAGRPRAPGLEAPMGSLNDAYRCSGCEQSLEDMKIEHNPRIFDTMLGMNTSANGCSIPCRQCQEVRVNITRAITSDAILSFSFVQLY
jgi:hypothetical protein